MSKHTISHQSPAKRLIQSDGSISLEPFRTQSGVWRVIGTESTGRGMESCIDEIYNKETGEYVKRTRLQLKDLEDKGYITII